ncbi:MAG: hypothetical protein AMXMBFR82_51060 [Candidatus Hydrogenedentota bacterium]
MAPQEWYGVLASSGSNALRDAPSIIVKLRVVSMITLRKCTRGWYYRMGPHSSGECGGSIDRTDPTVPTDRSYQSDHTCAGNHPPIRSPAREQSPVLLVLYVL